MPLNNEQLQTLLKPILPKRVMQANGQSHVPAYDVAAHLTRIFGYGNWETSNVVATLASESSEERTGKNGQKYLAWTVVYTATLRLTIKDMHGNYIASWENGAAGDAVNQPSRGDAHHLAMTTAISTAMKRCAAFGLGDQFGLSLYNKGSKSALVVTTLQTILPGTEVDLQENSPEPQSLGNDEKQVLVTDETANTATGEVEGDYSDPFDDLREAFRTAGYTQAGTKLFCEKIVGRNLTNLSDLSDQEAVDVFLELSSDVAGSEGLTGDEV